MTDDEKRAQLVSSGRLLKKSGAFAKKVSDQRANRYRSEVPPARN